MAALLVAGTCGCSSEPPPRKAAESLVTRRAHALWRNGRPFRFVGVNCYRLAAYPEQSDEIFATFATNGVKVVRFWAFQYWCGPNGRDYAALDALVGAARRHDVLLLPVLDNHWAACQFGGGVKSPEWYAAGWRDRPFGGAPLSYLDHLRALAAHYRDEPQIFAWQLVNEPEIYPESPDHFGALRRFARDASAELKRADPNHLVSLGLLGGGQPSTSGWRFRELHDAAVIDLVSAHDHAYIFEPLPGATGPGRPDSMFSGLDAARRLRKPFVVTESCIPLPWVGQDPARRADLFRAKLDAFFRAGAAGYLLWNYEPVPESPCGFGPADPVWKHLADTARRL